MRMCTSRRFLKLTLAGLMIGSTMISASVGGATGTTGPNSASNWTVYHGEPSGSGVSTVLTSVTTTKRAWTSPSLDGQLYGEPLIYSGEVYVATENDTVYALSSTNGTVKWSRHVGSAVPSSQLPCGNISPSVGITGTPVIDPSRNEIFVVADEMVSGSPAHVLVGLSTSSGAIELRQRVDPSGANPIALLERTGLALDAGRVVFAMGGNYGDCAAYRGRVVSVSEGGSSPTFFTVDAKSANNQGAIWMGGAAPVVDAKGNIWVSVGNGSVHSAGEAYDDSDSALELSASLHLKQFFAPANWPQNNASDLDMSTAPVLLSDGQVIVAGKSRIVYLLNGAKLGGIGREEASLDAACSQDIDGGSATLGDVVYLPCVSGPVAVRASTSPQRLTKLWSSNVGGGPPIVAANLVWTVGQDGVLYGLAPSTGRVRQQASIGVPANHFPTPSVGDALMVVSSSNHVVAFHGNAAQ
jgi:outer membrane protein assembly factor BamB